MILINKINFTNILKVCLMRTIFLLNMIKTLILISILFLTSCSKITEFNGFDPGSETLATLDKGKKSKSNIKELLGEPTMVQGKNGNTWIYFGQEKEQLAFLKPKLISRTVILLTFNNSGILNSKEIYTMKDSMIIDINSNKVVSGGRKLTILQQIFGNIGNFSSQSF